MAELFIGLMSGTSLDGVDAALVEFNTEKTIKFRAAHYLAYTKEQRQAALALHTPGADDLHNAALLANDLAKTYALVVQELLAANDLTAADICAIGCHGQTLRHNPAQGYTLQLNNAALLTELSGISVVADFRSRDIAAGGQGAPLVPAFHTEVFRHPSEHRVVLNIGGIANITNLPPQCPTSGFDTGPGNMLLDAWIQEQRGLPYDADGAWGAQGKVLPVLLQTLLAHEYLHQAPPKSCGREQFNLEWLQNFLKGTENTADVQATLTAFSVRSMADAIQKECGIPHKLMVCGGGARNLAMMAGLRNALPATQVSTTSDFGYPADWLEAIAFAWLAQRTLHGLPGNLPEVTGAKGSRILGAIYRC